MCHICLLRKRKDINKKQADKETTVKSEVKRRGIRFETERVGYIEGILSSTSDETSSVFSLSRIYGNSFVS